MAAEDKPIHHPIFARIYARLGDKAEGRGQAEHRRALLEGLHGRVVEVGAGNGLNFPHYPSTVSEVVAIEPEGYLRERAQAAIAGARVPVRVLAGRAEELPVEAESFDVGVASLVLCSVADQRRSLAELFRVIRPGGELRFYEHVVSERALPAALQRASDATWWPPVAGGCHMSRDTGAAIVAAGFVVESVERFPFTPFPTPPRLPHILGTARRPAPRLQAV